MYAGRPQVESQLKVSTTSWNPFVSALWVKYHHIWGHRADRQIPLTASLTDHALIFLYGATAVNRTHTVFLYLFALSVAHAQGNPPLQPSGLRHFWHIHPPFTLPPLPLRTQAGCEDDTHRLLCCFVQCEILSHQLRKCHWLSILLSIVQK